MMLANRLVSAALFIACIGLQGCHSTGVDVTIRNNARVPMRNVELDYPGASFGIGSIGAGSSYTYRIKPTGNGQMILSFDQENGKAFREPGPKIDRGIDATLIILVDQDASNEWRMRVENR
jgi:hypothetical protein